MVSAAFTQNIVFRRPCSTGGSGWVWPTIETVLLHSRECVKETLQLYPEGPFAHKGGPGGQDSFGVLNMILFIHSLPMRD